VARSGSFHNGCVSRSLSILRLSQLPSSITSRCWLYIGWSPAHFLPWTLPNTEATRRKKTMSPLSLFPPPGAPEKPLPEDVQHAASQLLAELLTLVIEETRRPSEEGEEHE
jgi:hypothetical protein